MAVTRGPLVYCAEEADNGGPVQRLFVPDLPPADAVKIDAFADGPRCGKRSWRWMTNVSGPS
ncbi:MAG TPA: hypothetical protein VNE39_01540 [Planctomycetota bacterium]|nr:hypothetical protein [Planctomycetota bacterium]